MPRTETTQRQHDRGGAGYARDLTDGEWAVVAPFLPLPRRLGRPQTADLRAVMNAIPDIVTTGCQWRQVPRAFPPRSTVQRYFCAWRDRGLWQTIRARLVMVARDADGREASPGAGIIDSQSVKTTESGGIRGFDAGKKGMGRNRHIVTDPSGLRIGVRVHGADIQDRDGAPMGLASIRHSHPWVRQVFAGGGDAGDPLRTALAGPGTWTVQIVKRSDTACGLKVLSRRRYIITFAGRLRGCQG